MQQRHYKTIIYFISAVILITLTIQIYWNYKNYEAEKAQLVRDVQISIDNAVEQYYENIAKNNTKRFLNLDQKSTVMDSSFSKLSKSIDNGNLKINNITIEKRESGSDITSVQQRDQVYLDSLMRNFSNVTVDSSYKQTLEIFDDKGKTRKTFTVNGDSELAVDSILTKIRDGQKNSFAIGDQTKEPRQDAFEILTSKIIISLDDEAIDPPTVDSLFIDELVHYDLTNLNHTLQYTRDTVKIPLESNLQKALLVNATSELLPKKASLEIGFSNVASTVLKRNLIGILLSLLLVSAVIASLLYLLKIIKEQKQLAEVKNDFISNITHEFKTPIATIGVAMESIQHFNTQNDLAKTKKYVDMSSQQVHKLNTMVEKLLETATLNSDALLLNKQDTNIGDLLEHIVQSHQTTLNGKKLALHLTNENTYASVDIFHLENALDNLIDNAIKYGGDLITITANKTNAGMQIIVQDNGNSLTKAQTSQIFEKFYRVPKGNTHDVKGFGIGLYYTKTIIEKHGGIIAVATQPTTFKITLPYV